MISMYPGQSNPKYVGVTRYQNGQSQINRMIEVNNGMTNSTIYKGLDGELVATKSSHVFDEVHTNGMQFSPLIWDAKEQV